MAPRRPNLAALAEAAGSTRTDRAQQPLASPAIKLDDPATAKTPSRTSSREGQKPITGFFAEDVRIQLKMMSAEQRRSMESMIGEALNDLFAKYGKPEIVSYQS